METLKQQIEQHIAGEYLDLIEGHDLTVVVAPDRLVSLCYRLRDEDVFSFEQLIDCCGIDYSDYGYSYWQTKSVATTGYTRGVNDEDPVRLHQPPTDARFAVIYQLLSLKHNRRLTLRVDCPDSLVIPSLFDVWPAVNWFEREAFDLFGIFFEGHPDLRRILTDYGFKGHPFRKDFPLIGEVEMHYDAEKERCVYGPVSIEPRVLVPKVIRIDSRYVECDDNKEGRN